MNTVELALVVAGLVIGVGVGYDAERWGRSVNLWSLAGALFSVVALVAWLLVRHWDANGRREAGVELPPGMWRWLRLRRHARIAGAS
ncbi:MAG: hypothetical protein ACLQT7_09335 [Candidatus Dormibacteria bacterium]